VNGIRNSDWARGSWGDDGVIVLSPWDSGLFRVSVDEPVLQPLTSPVIVRHNSPSLLPGSEALLFNTQEDETTTIQVLDLTSPEATPETLFPDASHPH